MTCKLDEIYRPEWTCGRYDEKHRVAIYYNLIEGMAYFFEEESAGVIGEILSLGRNGHVTISQLSQRTNINELYLEPFIDELYGLNLVCSTLPSKDDILQYRELLSNNTSHANIDNELSSWESLPISRNSAEMAYSDMINGIGGVMFELTYNCTERCIHCYNIGAARNDKEISRRDIGNYLSLDEYKQIIDDLYDEGLYKVCLTGGDPFANPFVWDIIDYLYKRDIAIDIFTNGLLLVGHVEKLLNYYPRLVSISLYSDSPEVHDSITRVNGSWNKTMSVIKQFSSMALPMNLKCCVMQPNFKSYRGVSKIGKTYGIPVQFELNITDSIDGDKCASRHLRLTPEQMEIVLCDMETPMYVGKEVDNYGGVKRNKEQRGCSAGQDTFNVTPDGKFTPCCAFHLELGDLHLESVKSIVKNSGKLKKWRSLKLSDFYDCGNIDYCLFCNLCPGNNYSEHGTPRKCSENNRFIAKVRYELMKKKKQGYDPLNGKNLLEKIEQMPDYICTDLNREMK